MIKHIPVKTKIKEMKLKVRTQTTSKILMVEPTCFAFNEETAVNNFFQVNEKVDAQIVQEKALKEFNDLVSKIRENGVEVVVVKDTKTPHTPDSIFPNNWFITEPGGELFLSSMFAENRRLERFKHLGVLIDNISDKQINMTNYSVYENEDKFLEGTGCLIFDRVKKVAFASLSKRCDKDLFMDFCKNYEFSPVAFNSFQTFEGKRLPIYHTNVMMAIGTDFAVICLDSIDDKNEKDNVVSQLKKCNKEIIDITEQQMANFAGNIIQVSNKNEDIFTIMSTSAYNAFTTEQKEIMEKNSKIIHADISTIEKLGGGSARCMVAELF